MMTPRLQDACLPPRTLVVACTEAGAYDPTWVPMLRRHARVVPSRGADVAAAEDSLVAALQAHPIERVLVLGHLGCRARGGARAPLAANTAAVTAFRRYADAACALVTARARGELAREHADTKLDVLVSLANLEACAELHAAIRSGSVSAHALVYDPATREVEVFDGAGFHAAPRTEIDRLFTGADASSLMREHDFAGAFAALAHGHAPALGAQPGGTA